MCSVVLCGWLQVVGGPALSAALTSLVAVRRVAFVMSVVGKFGDWSLSNYADNNYKRLVTRATMQPNLTRGGLMSGQTARQHVTCALATMRILRPASAYEETQLSDKKLSVEASLPTRILPS